MRFVDSCISEARMSPALSGSSAIRRFEGKDAVVGVTHHPLFPSPAEWPFNCELCC